MSKLLLKDVFEELNPDLLIDKRVVDRIQQILHSFINRNPDHSAFFGGNLLGVQVVKMLESDQYNFVAELLDIDPESTQKRIYQCTDINKDFEVSSNVFNVSCMYLCHRIATSKLDKKLKEQAINDVLTFLQIKFVTGRLFRLFPYPADKAVAEATYASLTNKYAIKEHGTWLNWLRYRSKELMQPGSKTWQSIFNFEPNYGVVLTLNTAQTQIRSMLKFYRRAMEQVRVSGGKIVSASSIISVEGVEMIRDKNNTVQKHLQYLRSVVSDVDSFVRGELVNLICKIQPSAQERYLVNSLRLMSANYYKNNHAEYERVFELLLVHAADYLSASRNTSRTSNDLGTQLIKLRGAYTSARSTDTDLLDLRESFEKLIKPAVDSKTASVLASVRTAVMLYLIARAYTMNHYTQ